MTGRRPCPAAPGPLEEYAARFDDLFGRSAQRRGELRLSTQQLADRCEQLGMAGLTRQVLARLEHGRRESVSTAELAVIAAALETAPVLLQYSVGVAESAEYLPGRLAPPYDAARWWGGEAGLSKDGDIAAARGGLRSSCSATMPRSSPNWTTASLRRVMHGPGGTSSARPG
jgi:transcriptional regulator with XRE-family HTH domain